MQAVVACILRDLLLMCVASIGYLTIEEAERISEFQLWSQ